jgi:hypothetical protein
MSYEHLKHSNKIPLSAQYSQCCMVYEHILHSTEDKLYVAYGQIS